MIDPRTYTIHLATDHAGLAHKDAVEAWLRSEGFKVEDHGAYTLDPLDDFTDAVLPAADAVSQDPKHTKAIIFGGSGQGEAMIANRLHRVRAAVFYGGNEDIVRLSRQHNDANILSIGARFVDINTTKKVVWDWLHTEPSPDKKYKRRSEEIDSLTDEL